MVNAQLCIMCVKVITLHCQILEFWRVKHQQSKNTSDFCACQNELHAVAVQREETPSH